VVNHPPRSSVLLLTSLCADKFAGTPLGSLFVDGEPDLRASVGGTYLDNVNGSSDYYPQWLDKLADDVTLEGAAMNGTARGAGIVRSIVLYARTLYEHQVSALGAVMATMGSSSNTPRRSKARPLVSLSGSPVTPPGPSTSQSITGRAARCCSSPA
jgi:hypothetical protein